MCVVSPALPEAGRSRPTFRERATQAKMIGAERGRKGEERKKEKTKFNAKSTVVVVVS